MATAIDTKEWSDEYNDAKCSICAKENKDEIADYYCYDCNKHMCTSCITTHNKFIENHNVVQGLGDGKDVLTEKCGKHADELITLYCRQHDTLLCRKCHLMDHSKQLRQVNIRLPEDKSACDIKGCCHLGDGSLVIGDYNNRRLKHVDPSSGKVIMHCDTDGQPTDVCCIGPQEVAVAFSLTQVHVYNAASLTRTRTIVLERKTHKIACHGGLLYCAIPGLGDYTLYVHDVSSGRKLREICLDGIKHCIIKGTAVNGNRLYVTDWSGLQCVNMDGQRIFHLPLKDVGLSYAQGVTTDHHGHVIVCCGESNKVVKVTEDGHVVGEILSGKDGIVHPHCLSYDVSKSQLCVGGKSDQILMVECK